MEVLRGGDSEYVGWILGALNLAETENETKAVVRKMTN